MISFHVVYHKSTHSMVCGYYPRTTSTQDEDRCIWCVKAIPEQQEHKTRIDAIPEQQEHKTRIKVYDVGMLSQNNRNTRRGSRVSHLNLNLSTNVDKLIKALGPLLPVPVSCPIIKF
jgi:hypothetical protein